MNKRIKQIALLSLLGFVIGTGVAWMQVSRELSFGYQAAKIEPASGPMAAETAPGGAFTLTDQDGNAVTEKDYADSYKLVFFGFTNCPDVCPVELQKIATVMKALGPRAADVTPLFISVDPQRDTPDVMKEYTAQFDPRIIGLTGTPEQVKAAEAAYKVYAARVDDPSLSDYTMNHSSYTFFMSPDGKLISLFSPRDAASDIVKQMMQAL